MLSEFHSKTGEFPLCNLINLSAKMMPIIHDAHHNLKFFLNHGIEVFLPDSILSGLCPPGLA
jgi:hypothetical protein